MNTLVEVGGMVENREDVNCAALRCVADLGQ